MIILKIIEILLGFERVWNRRRNETLIPTDSRNRLRSLLFWNMDQERKKRRKRMNALFHGKAGFHHISKVNRILSPEFLSLFLPYRVVINP